MAALGQPRFQTSFGIARKVLYLVRGVSVSPMGEGFIKATKYVMVVLVLGHCRSGALRRILPLRKQLD